MCSNAVPVRGRSANVTISSVNIVRPDMNFLLSVTPSGSYGSTKICDVENNNMIDVRNI
jgi:hypothetical protein